MSDEDRRGSDAGESYGRAGGYNTEPGESPGEFRDGGRAGLGSETGQDGSYTGQTGTGYGTAVGVSDSDRLIRDAVEARLAEDPFLDASHIQISVSDGEVTLGGTVTARTEKRRAEDLAKGVGEVRQVHNALQVQDASEG